MSNFDIFLDLRLRNWALFCERILVGGLGFPKKSVIAKIAEYGVRVSVPASSRVLLDCDMNDEIKEIDDAVQDLSSYKSILAKVIMLRYMCSGNLKDELQRQNMSHSTYKKNLALAKAFIACALRKNLKI
jgi:hypothetical protein